MAEVEEFPLIPEVRAKDGARGVPVAIEGRTWLLAHGGLSPILDGFRDRMNDQAQIRDQVEMLDVFEVGRLCLLGNYDLSEPEVLGLLKGAKGQDLTDAVMGALFGGQDTPRTYTMWATSGLYAAGLDPDKIPPEFIPEVLYQLVKVGRMVPIGEYTDAAIAAPRIKQMRAQAARQAEMAAASVSTGEANGADGSS